ncbi:solute carrier family 40 member 2 [Carex littledalei]|uniref:Solute carrier family 40 member n=1 Tax=Carex littledalei TaxID=544730 RepID=A0A833VY16_9POAL|nr:solute carrier family 40 member 2 [Carex littledalei]
MSTSSGINGGAWLFAILLSKYDHVTCIKIACGISVCTLPLLLVLNKVANHLSLGVVEQSTSRSSPRSCEKSHSSDWLLNPKNIVKDGLMAIKRGWNEYVSLPVLPASVTYVLLCFNTALSPGSLMTTFLTHRAGLNPYMLGVFSGSSALFGILATFVSASLVKRLGIFKIAVYAFIKNHKYIISYMYSRGSWIIIPGFAPDNSRFDLLVWTEPMSQGTSLTSFLALIVLSRWGQMSYSVIGLQIIQTAVHPSKANLIGTTENSIASLAELVMMGVAVLASDVSHFGLLTTLSVCSVVAATGFYCHWLARTTSIL